VKGCEYHLLRQSAARFHGEDAHRSREIALTTEQWNAILNFQYIKIGCSKSNPAKMSAEALGM
jgi:hypothetical protein